MLMAKNYSNLSKNIRERLNPDNVILEKAFSDELSSLSYSDVLTYIRLAMRGVEPEYTQKSKDAGENVKTHLNRELSNAAYRYQGSVMTNTHIKGHSDIDLLVISDKFYTYDRVNVQSLIQDYQSRVNYPSAIKKLEEEESISKYAGNSTEDLKKLRSDSENILSTKYTICDTNHSKAIKIHNQNLHRDVDVVIANWYDDVRSIVNDKGIYRGIQVYDKCSQSVGKADYPFLSIDRINQRSSETSGKLKNMIRFLKNVKADSDQDIKLSSFDINAICYDIPTSKYQNESKLNLVLVLYNQLKSIVDDKIHADKVVSVDEEEYIFKDKQEKLDEVKKILAEVESICLDYINVKPLSTWQ